VTRPVAALLELGRAVTVAGVAREIERRAGTAERPIVRLSGVADRDAADALRGEDLMVARGETPELGEGEWWAHELEGCAVVDGERAVGEVRELRGLPSVDVLVVERDDGSELLVPLVGDAVRSVDVGARRIDVDLAFLEGPEA
jgi:16S rRNA processing protein RimM